MTIPKYFAGDLWKRLPLNASGGKDPFAQHPSIFIGKAGSGGALHVDSLSSTFWQILLQGRKRWTFYLLPDDWRRALLYAGVVHEIMPRVPLANEHHNSSELPLLDLASRYKVVAEVGPGEVMAVPPDVPHMVENLEDVLAISMNILDARAAPRALEDMRARACYSQDPSLRENIRVLSHAVESLQVAAESSRVDMSYWEYKSQKALW